MSWIKKINVIDRINNCLYDKSKLIKQTFIAELDEYVGINNANSYFGKKPINEDTNVVNPTLRLPFLIDNEKNKEKLGFQLTKVAPQLNDKKKKLFHFKQHEKSSQVQKEKEIEK